MGNRLAVLDSDRCVGCQSCMFACARKHGEGGLGNSRIWVRSDGGIERGFVVIVCRACPDPQCMKVCPAGALTPRRGGGVILVPERCLGCRLCVEACPLGAVFWDEGTNKPAICIHCGFCVKYCPHWVLKLERREEVNRAAQ